MTHPIGVDRYRDPDTGQVVGTAPLHVRQWIWSLYDTPDPAIAAGLKVIVDSSQQRIGSHRCKRLGSNNPPNVRERSDRWTS